MGQREVLTIHGIPVVVVDNRDENYDEKGCLACPFAAKDNLCRTAGCGLTQHFRPAPRRARRTTRGGGYGRN